MYPHYTYYYPHYLQTKVRAALRGCDPFLTPLQSSANGLRMCPMSFSQSIPCCPSILSISGSLKLQKLSKYSLLTQTHTHHDHQFFIQVRAACWSKGSVLTSSDWLPVTLKCHFLSSYLIESVLIGTVRLHPISICLQAGYGGRDRGGSGIVTLCLSVSSCTEHLTPSFPSTTRQRQVQVQGMGPIPTTLLPLLLPLLLCFPRSPTSLSTHMHAHRHTHKRTTCTDQPFPEDGGVARNVINKDSFSSKTHKGALFPHLCSLFHTYLVHTDPHARTCM